MNTVEQILVCEGQKIRSTDMEKVIDIPPLIELGYKPNGITSEEFERTQPCLVKILNLVTKRVGGVPIDTENGERKDGLFKRGSFGLYSDIRELHQKFEIPLPKVEEDLLSRIIGSDLLIDIRRTVIIGNKVVGRSIDELLDQIETEYPKDLKYMKTTYGGYKSSCFLGAILTFSLLRLEDFNCIHYSY